MKLVAKIKLLLTPEQKVLVDDTMTEYIRSVNEVLTTMIDYDQHFCFGSKMIKADIPSCLKNQVARDALSMDAKMFKYHIKQPELKKPYASWNNQNYTISKSSIAFPVFKDGESHKITVEALIPDELFVFLQQQKLGSLRITKKGSKYIAQIAYKAQKVTNTNNGVMGVDLGLKCPAVAVTDDGKVQFFGNGRKNKYIRRKYNKKRNKLQKHKKLNAVNKFADKEQRIMKDIDHKLSRQIVDYAYANGIKTIKLEVLAGIRAHATIGGTTRKSRKNNKQRKAKKARNKYLNSWSFYRLQSFIKYKAEKLGIKVIEVDPKFTSQKCPNCGKNNKTSTRNYTCDCGYHCHRDVVGAINICNAEEIEPKAAGKKSA